MSVSATPTASSPTLPTPPPAAQSATPNSSNQPKPHPPQQPRSWSEALQLYQQHKHTTPTLPHAPPPRYLPLTHPLHTDAIHTITGQYKRKQREEGVRAVEVAAEERRLERLQHIPTRAYNIVNNQPIASQSSGRRASATSTPTTTTTAAESTTDDSHASRREYDIVTNYTYYPDSEQRLKAEQDLQLQRLRNHAAVKLQRERRDYNNITHTYYQHNDEKQQVDEASNVASLQRKYFAGRHYDAVQGQYCDPRKEDEWRRRRVEEEQRWAGRRAGGQTGVGQLISGGPL